MAEATGAFGINLPGNGKKGEKILLTPLNESNTLKEGRQITIKRNKMLKSKNVLRDIIFFILLLAISKKTIERTWIHIKKEQPALCTKSEVHELDTNFLVSLEETKKQIDQAIEIAKTSELHTDTVEQLTKMKSKLKQIEQKFKKNSPATFLLGPLGTTAIVLKEKKLEKKLIEIMNNLGTILYAFQGNQEESNLAIVSVDQGLAKNKHLLGYIT